MAWSWRPSTQPVQPFEPATRAQPLDVISTTISSVRGASWYSGRTLGSGLVHAPIPGEGTVWVARKAPGVEEAGELAGVLAATVAAVAAAGWLMPMPAPP